MKWRKDIFGNPSTCVLTFKEGESKENYLNRMKDNESGIRLHNKGDQEEDFWNRVLVLENLPDDWSQEELLLTLQKYCRVQKVFMPHYVFQGEVKSSFQTKQHVWENTDKYSDQIVQIEEFGTQPNTHTVYEDNQFKNFDLDNFEHREMKKFDLYFQDKIKEEEEYIKNFIQKDFNKVTYPTIQDKDI